MFWGNSKLKNQFVAQRKLKKVQFFNFLEQFKIEKSIRTFDNFGKKFNFLIFGRNSGPSGPDPSDYIPES